MHSGQRPTRLGPPEWTDDSACRSPASCQGSSQLSGIVVPEPRRARRVGCQLRSWDSVRSHPFVWGPVADQYDIVGFDPRGIARSTPLRCFGNERQAVQVFPPFPFPSTEDEVDLFIPGDQLFIDQCDQRGNKVLGHMSTANVARDMDHMRELFGNEKMNYVGISYGTFLGQTYANMFPDNVGAFVIDAVLDPIAWSNLRRQCSILDIAPLGRRCPRHPR